MRKVKGIVGEGHEHRLPQITTAIMALICVMVLLSPSAFADDAGTGSDGVAAITVSIVCSEHGSVNEKTGEFTETVPSGGDLHLSFAADEGYLIGKVLINDEPLAAADLEGIAGEQTGQIDLEGLEEDLSLQIVFMTPGDYADQEISPGTTGDPATGGGDDPGAGSDTPGDSTGDTPVDDPGSNDPTVQDDPGSDDPAEVSDPSAGDTGDAGDGSGTDGSGSEDDEEGFDPNDDWGAEDDAADPDSDEYQGTYDDDELGAQESEDTETDDTGVVEADTETTEETGSDGVTRSTGTAASKTVFESDTDSDEDEYKGDYGTPKTGDDALSSAAALLLMGIGFLYLACILASFEDAGQDEGGDSE